jgi:ribosomal protein S18 acetylase RimI-like enzyme
VEPTIRPVSPDDRKRYQEHIVRIRAESNRADEPFTPVTPADRIDPTKLDFDAFVRPLTEPKWRRGFAIVTEDGWFVGHAELKGDEFHAGVHRCELGIGIERPYRRLGFGRRLIQNAIEFARGSNTVEWIDLFVFGHNVAARALYRNLGFKEVGAVTDRFRIAGRSIDDVIMTLRLREGSKGEPSP